MARSRRAPAYYICYGARPDQGKKATSGEIRARSRDICRAAAAGVENDDAHIEGRTRGSAGTRDRDHGWKYFGDGRGVAPRSHPMYDRLCRK